MKNEVAFRNNKQHNTVEQVWAFIKKWGLGVVAIAAVGAICYLSLIGIMILI